MAKWGGKYSAPFIVQLLDDTDPLIPLVCYEQLGIVKEPSVLDTIVKRCATGESNSQAGRCLDAYGEEAEPEVLKHLSEADKPGLKRLLDYLRDHGTARSIEPLQSLRVRWVLFDSSITADIDSTIKAIQRQERRNGR